MNKAVLLLFLGGMLAGCQTTTPQTNVSASATSSNVNYIGKSKTFQKKYMACLLVEGLAQHGKRQSAQISQGSVKSKCRASGQQYYDAAYANAWLNRSDAPKQWKRATAAAAKKDLENLVFERLAQSWKRAEQKG